MYGSTFIQVYTYFGKEVERFYFSENELSVDTHERVRKFIVKYEKETGKKVWTRTK